MIRVSSLCALTLFCAPAILPAQTAFSVDVGGSNVTYIGGGTTSAASLSPFFSALSPRASFTAIGNYSSFSSGGSSIQGTVNASLLSSATAAFRLEALGMFSGTSFSGGTSSNATTGRARAHLVSANSGLWVGGGAGRSSDGEITHNIVLGDFAAWFQNGPALFQVNVTPTQLRNEVTYTDTEASVSLFGSRADLYASAGARMLRGGNASWLNAGITYRMASWVSAVASAGNYAPDYTQGTPGGRYISAALRFTSPVRSRLSPSTDVASGALVPLLPANERPAPNMLSDFSAREVTSSGNSREIRVRAPGAESVEVMGDFSDWSPLRMRNAGNGWWVTTVTLPAGIYHLNVRRDGGSWTVPAGMTAIDDEFGGSAGLLVIE